MKTRSVSFYAGCLAGAAAAIWLAALPSLAADAPAGAKAFDTAQQAADAVVQAAAAGDTAALMAIFGPDGKDIVSSGDNVSDTSDLTKFAELAHQKMSVKVAPANKAVIIVGPEDWPMPVPIVQKNGKWRFDTKAGKHEILARRIGGNELDAIKLLRGYAEAQEEYASQAHDETGRPQYAQKWVSTPGKRDGLSWYDANGKPAGPMGDDIAKALAEGYTDKAQPYNGYHFRTLTGQGKAARLGARDYVVQGLMIGGFAAIAWPANYGVTGIQTFIVNNDGIVFEKDLGPDTAKIAPGIKLFNPDKGWHETDDEE